MSQHSMLIANQTFPAFRADLNSALGALASLSSASSAPASPVVNQLWLDTSTTPLVLRFFDGADWIALLSIDAAANTAVPVLASDALSGNVVHGGVISAFASTGIDDNATQTRLVLSDAETVLNEDGADHDVRIEGNTDANLLKVDAGANRVGVGVAEPSEKIEIAGRVKADAFLSRQFTLEDDTAIAVSLGVSASGWCFIASNHAETARGAFMFGLGASPFVDSENAVGLAGTLTTGALTGATGVDGDFTIAAHTDNSLYFENRTGSALTFAVTLLAPTV